MSECDVKWTERERPVIVTPFSPSAWTDAEARALDAVVVSPWVPRGVPVILAQLAFVPIALACVLWLRPRIVHGHIGAFGGLVAVLAKRLTGCMAVVHEMAWPANRFWRSEALARFVHREADAVRVPSLQSRQDVAPWGRSAAVVPCIAWEAESNLPRLLFAAPRIHQKGADVLDEAEAIARRQGGRFDLVRLDAVPHATLLRWLEWADVVLCPSRGESFGVLAHEAAANGCALVATRTGALADLIDAGLAHEVEMDDADALAHYLCHPPEPPEPEAVWQLRGRCSATAVGASLESLARKRAVDPVSFPASGLAAPPRGTHGATYEGTT